jgi:uncharacterized protein (DUF433 family)
MTEVELEDILRSLVGKYGFKRINRSLLEIWRSEDEFLGCSQNGVSPGVQQVDTEKGDQVPIWQDRIVKDPGILAGKPTIKGTRISVELITDYLKGGRTEKWLLREYPFITAEDIEACRQYKATGAKLSYSASAYIDATMDVI